MTTRWGSSSSSMNASLLMACSAPEKPSVDGRAPLAIRMWPPLSVCSPTATRSGATNRATPSKAVTPCSSKLRLHFSRNGVGETSFECDQLFPVNAHVAVDAASVHAPCEVNHFLAAYQHLLRVTSAQRTGAPKGAMVDHGH